VVVHNPFSSPEIWQCRHGSCFAGGGREAGLTLVVVSAGAIAMAFASTQFEDCSSGGCVA